MSIFNSSQGEKDNNKSGDGHLIIRGLAALYLAYLTYCIVRNFVKGESSMNRSFQICLMIIFALVTIAVALWTLRDYLSKRSQEALPEKNETDNGSETGDGKNE